MRLVSAVITTHNRLDLLKRAILSVYEQTYPDIELIVVDDASTDGTKEYCTSQSFRSICIPKEDSRGGNHARNLGIKAANGYYVAFLDDDDAWLPEKIEKQVKIIESKDCEVVAGGIRRELINGDTVKYVDNIPSPEYCGDISRKILQAICTTTSVLFVKRQALFDVGMFDESLKFWQEYELTIRLAQRKPFYFVNEPIIIYRVDMQDKHRLTNNFYEWKKTVSQIHDKHKTLYDKLNFRERLGTRLLVCIDSCGRCDSCGLTRLLYWNLFKAYLLRGILKLWKIKDKIFRHKGIGQH